MGQLSKNHVTTYKCISEGLVHGITGTRTKVHEIQGISVDWPDP